MRTQLKYLPLLLLLSLSSSAQLTEWEYFSRSHGPSEVAGLCREIESAYKKYSWGKSNCEKMPFEVFGKTNQGRPLVYFDVGPRDAASITLIQCTIHGDELPALPMCLNLIWEVLTKKRLPPKNTRLVIQPLLNPDGFFAKPKPTRQNAKGIDVNRNFPTRDFSAAAMNSWKAKEKRDPRKFPGNDSNSEPETQAIVKFIEENKPQKIISIHTPLGFLDLDARNDTEIDRRARYLAVNMVKNSGNYTFKSFGFYPGSLGNYGGQERNIPVYTLELPRGSPTVKTIDAYWVRFRPALWRAVDFDFDSGQFQED